MKLAFCYHGLTGSERWSRKNPLDHAKDASRAPKEEDHVATGIAKRPLRDYRSGDWPASARAEYSAASQCEDWETCNRLMHEYAGMPLPAPSPRRRRLGRPLRVVELVIDHLGADSEPVKDDPDPRERTARVGTAPIVTSPQSPAAADPDEMVGRDPFDSPETRAHRAERPRIQAAR